MAGPEYGFNILGPLTNQLSESIMAKLNHTLTVERLREVLHYDPETGIFTWKVTTRGRSAIGKTAGYSRPNGRLIIEIDEKPYGASKLAWLYVYGEFPPKKLTRINGIYSDNRIANFYDPYKPTPKKVSAPLTQERLKELFHYDPDTGLFTRRKRQGVHNVGDVAGTVNKAGYIAIVIDTQPNYAHRLVWLYLYGTYPELTIDHINGIRSDNRLCNLRIVDHQTNSHNRTSVVSKTGFLGVTGPVQRKSGIPVWIAQINVNRKNINLGSFRSPEAAHSAYLSAKKKYHREVIER